MIKKILGYFILSLPVLLIFGLTMYQLGVYESLIVMGEAIGIIVIILITTTLGIKLIS